MVKEKIICDICKYHYNYNDIFKNDITNGKYVCVDCYKDILDMPKKESLISKIIKKLL